MSRSASIERNTSETKIKLSIDLDGNGNGNIHTGIGFFDHMLNAFARHGFFDLDVEVEGDLYVDCHHTIEDVGIVLGEAIKQAVGDKKGIKRYGSFMLPMDALLLISLSFLVIFKSYFHGICMCSQLFLICKEFDVFVYWL